MGTLDAVQFPLYPKLLPSISFRSNPSIVLVLFQSLLYNTLFRTLLYSQVYSYDSIDTTPLKICNFCFLLNLVTHIVSD